MVGKKLWIAFSGGCLLLAVLLVSLNPDLAKLTASQPLYGHQTNFKIPFLPLEDQKSKPLNWDELSKSPFYISTGFTHCEHVCPMTMAQFRLMEKEFGQSTQFIFLTVDPKRDTPERMNEYLSFFSPHFIGARTEDTNTLKAFMASLKQSYNLGDGNQSIDHQNTIYLIHPNASGIIIYTGNRMDVYKMKDDLEKLNHS